MSYRWFLKISLILFFVPCRASQITTKTGLCWQVLDGQQNSMAVSSAQPLEQWLRENRFDTDAAIAHFPTTPDFQRFLQINGIQNWPRMLHFAKIHLVYVYLEQKWKASTLSGRKRDAALYLDLLKLGFRDDGFANPFHSRALLDRISAANLERLRFKMHEIAGQALIPAGFEAQIAVAVNGLDFQFYKSFYHVVSKVKAPLLTDQELDRLFHRGESTSFWESLMDGSNSVQFAVGARRAEVDQLMNRPQSLSGKSDTLDIVVSPQLADRFGFAVPRFLESHDVLAIFQAWNPEQVVDFLEPTQLRRQLIQYVLSTDDLRTLLHESASLFLQASFNITRSYGLENLKAAFHQPDLFLSRLFYWMKMPAGWAVHIPGAVPADLWHYPKTEPAQRRIARSAR